MIFTSLGHFIVSLALFKNRFSDIPTQKHPIGATPTEITLHNMDFSYALETLLENHYENGIRTYYEL